MEQIYTLNENGSVNNLVNRDIVHTNGLLHWVIQCWIINQEGKVLIQRRSATKDKSAGKWDVSFGGHCSQTNSKDIMLANLVKEAKEELGLTIDPTTVIKLGEIRYTSQKKQNREIQGIFAIYIDDKQKFTFEDGEVSEIKWIFPNELEQNILENKQEYANRLGAVNLLKAYFKSL